MIAEISRVLCVRPPSLPSACFWGALALAVCPSRAAQAAQTKQARPDSAQKPQAIFDERADGPELLAAALSRAGKENRRVLIVWGANWCGWCRALHALCESDETIKKELLYEYDVLRLDVGRFDRNRDLALKYGVDFKRNGIPFFTILDAEGHLLANQETVSLELKEEGRKAYAPAKVLELLACHRAPYFVADDLFTSALAVAQEQDKRLFLRFGTPWCSLCHKLDAWLASPEIEAILAKEFFLLNIDIDRTLGGGELFERFGKGERAGLPWFVFLDAHRNALATSDGPGAQSIGFPTEPAEIEHFGVMLTKSCKRLTPEDVAALKRSLAAAHESAEGEKAKPEPKSDPGREAKVEGG